ncbi:MAG: NAD(P)-dependent oxidoreductase [Pseudomonadota bacterium]
MTRPRLLITGAGGLLGHALCEAAAKDWDVAAMCRKTPPAVPGIRSVWTDITDKRDLDAVFSRERPHAVIHAAAMSQPNACELAPETSETVNVIASARIAARCAAAGIPLVFTSTDLVFDGTRPPYGETDPVSPICVYGRHKVAAEARLREIHPPATVCRLPLLFGYAPSGGGFLGELIRTLAAGGRPTLFIDEIRTPIFTLTAARGLLAMLAHPGRTLHLGGGQPVSRLHFGLLVAALMNVPASRITPARLGALAMPAPRAPDVSLDIRRAESLGFDSGDLLDDLTEAVERYRHASF